MSFSWPGGGGCQYSRGIGAHFINRVESVNFKDNHARVYYLYVECSALNVGQWLPYLLFTMRLLEPSRSMVEIPAR